MGRFSSDRFRLIPLGYGAFKAYSIKDGKVENFKVENFQVDLCLGIGHLGGQDH